jgi:hypothetical protein
MCYQKSSSARHEAGPGVGVEDVLPGLGTAGVLGVSFGPVDSAVRKCGGPADSIEDASSGFGAVAGELWIPEASSSALARGMEGEP